jgi:predicted enzyme related to lactoylglutathione lyase
MLFLWLLPTLIACHNLDESNSIKEKQKSNTIKETTDDMKSTIAIFEIPASKITRAVEFYQEIFDIKIEQMEMPGMQMGIFPNEGQSPFGVIVQSEEDEPSNKGVTIYFDAGDNLQTVLSKVEGSGGKIVVPKTMHADESGYFAIVIDSEGNKIGLHSPN